VNTQRIEGGFIIKPRAIQKSGIMRQPPQTREIWDYLCMNANHSDQVYNGNLVKRGQLFRNYKDIREALCWYVGWRKEMYSENQMKKAMKFLRDARMIDTEKELGGVRITICKYNRYQNPKNYERTMESTGERTNGEPLPNQPLPDTNKNGNNGINGKNGRGESKQFTRPTSVEVAQYMSDNTVKNYVTIQNAEVEAEKFMNHYTSNGWLIGGKSPMKDWKASVRNWLINVKPAKHSIEVYKNPGEDQYKDL